MERFSKKFVKNEISNRIRRLVDEFMIDVGNGYNQCEGKSAAFCRAYGEVDGLLRLRANLGL